MSNFLNLPATSKDLFRVVVETPRGAAVKLSFEPKTRVFEYSRPLPVGHTYPYDWGFIPSTLGDDGDPLDGLVIHEGTTAPGVIVKCDLLGAVRMSQKDNGGRVTRNDRYIFRPHKEDAPDQQLSPKEVPRELQVEIEQFFLSSVIGSDKRVKLKGWQSAKEAVVGLKKGMKAFRKVSRA